MLLRLSPLGDLSASKTIVLSSGKLTLISFFSAFRLFFLFFFFFFFSDVCFGIVPSSASILLLLLLSESFDASSSSFPASSHSSSSLSSSSSSLSSNMRRLVLLSFCCLWDSFAHFSIFIIALCCLSCFASLALLCFSASLSLSSNSDLRFPSLVSWSFLIFSSSSALLFSTIWETSSRVTPVFALSAMVEIGELLRWSSFWRMMLGGLFHTFLFGLDGTLEMSFRQMLLRVDILS